MKLLTLIALSTAFAAFAGDVKLLTVHKLADSFGIYDLETGKLENEIPVGVKPHEFALTPDLRYAFVTDYGLDSYSETKPGGNTITVVDLKDRKVTAKIETGEFRRPHGIELLPSGLFYITTEIPAAIHVLEPRQRRILRTFRITGKLPHMLVVTHDERKAWTANTASGDVSVVDLKSGKQTASIATGGVPMGFALSKDEKTLYLATRDGNEVVVIDTAKDQVTKRIPMPGQPGRLLLSADNKLLVCALIGSNEVAVVDVATGKEIKRAGGFARAEGMTLAQDGKSFFLAAQMDNKIYRLSLPGLERLQVIETKAKPDPMLVWRQLK